MAHCSTEDVMPAAVAAERTILGCALLHPDTLMQTTAILSPEDFSLDSHRRLFARMMEMTASGLHLELGSLANELATHKEIESIGGVAYVASLTDGLPGRSNVEYYAKTVRDKANLRRLINACESAIAVAKEQELTADHCAAALQDDLLSIQAHSTISPVKHAKEFMPEVIRELEMQASKRGLVGLTTGVPVLDERTTGIRPGELWVVGALPARGKTAFGLGLAGDNLEKDVPVAIFSLEMSDRQLGRRLLANRSGVKARTIRDPQYLNASDWNALSNCTGDIMKWPLYVDDASFITTREIAAKARLYVRRHQVKLIVVDYLMLVDEPREKEMRLKARRIANTFRQIAKDENVAVVLLSQLSRPKDGNLNTRPNMLHLRESGDIEAAAHTVLLLYMPFDENDEPTGEEEIVIGKQREGRMGSVKVSYNRDRLRFYDRT